MPLKQHAFYVYHEENRVMARRGAEPPVIAETCKDAQEAHDKVQAIVNPEDLHPHARLLGGPSGPGFLHPEFQVAISENCREYVLSAYERAKGR